MYNKKATLLLVGIVLMIAILAGCKSNKDKTKENNENGPVITDTNISDENRNEGLDDTGQNQKVDDENKGLVGDEDKGLVDGENKGLVGNEDKRLVEDVDVETIPVPNEPSTSNYIHFKVDKNQGEVGDIIKAEINVNIAANFAGYQVNIKYDPEVLQPVNYDTQEPFGRKTIPTGATMLINEEFLPLNIVDNDIEKGFLNFGTTYMSYPDYKATGAAEKSGTLAVIGFKILKKESTVIGFENSETMPTGKTGTMLFNWDGNRLSSYEIVGVQKIN